MNERERERERETIYICAAGTHPLWAYPFASDFTSDDGQLYRTVPTIIDVTTNPPRWIATWDGFWGASGGSPKTPGKQVTGTGPPWTDAWGWHGNANGCTLPGSFHATLRAPDRASTGAPSTVLPASASAHEQATPALPRLLSARVVSGTKYGKAIRVQYCFRSLPTDTARRPWRLHLTVENLRDNLPPLTVPWRVRKRCAVVIQPVGGIKPPYLLRYSVESRQGTRSAQAKRTLR